YDFRCSAWDDGMTTKLGYPEGVAVSFSFPRKLSTGRVLVPMQKGVYDAESSSFNHYRDYWSRAYQALAMIGEYSENGDVVLFMSRFGENGTEKDPAGLSKSSCCRYRIEI
ncbi:MAG: hypothetical protein ACLFSE_14105, partial [Spirochaetia bacterium]